MNTILNEQECRTILGKLDVLTAGVERAIAALDDPWSDRHYSTARDLRDLLDRLQSSGIPGQLEPPPESVRS